MKDWTVMVYMAGDNNLSEDMVTSLSRIGEKFANGSDKSKVAVLAYYDSGATGFPSRLFDFPKNKFEELPFETETSTDSVYAFVNWCVDKDKKGYKAKHYALILSGHGDGFQPGSFLKDQTSNNAVTIKSLADKLHKINKHELKQKLDILGFDSCVMSSVEVAYEMSEAAEILVGSQGYVPFYGWDYGKIIEKMQTSQSELTTTNVAQIFAESFYESYLPYADYAARSVDICYCNLEGAKKVAGKVNILGEKLTEILQDRDAATSKQIEHLILSSHWQCQTLLFDQCIDISDFCQNFKKECDVVGKDNQEISEISRICGEIIQMVEDCAKSRQLGADFQFSTGLSLYFPWSYISYLITRPQFLDLDFAVTKKNGNAPSGWTNFLDTYLFKTLRDYEKNTEIKKKIRPDQVKAKALENLAHPVLGVNPLEKNKVDPMVKDKVDPMVKDKLMTGSYIENFKRMKNFPWMEPRSLEYLFAKKTSGDRKKGDARNQKKGAGKRR